MAGNQLHGLGKVSLVGALGKAAEYIEFSYPCYHTWIYLDF